MDEKKLSQLLAQFQTEGFYILRNFLEQTIIEEARAGVSKIVNAYAEKLYFQNKVPELYINEPFEKRLYRLYENNIQEAPSLFRSELHLEEFFHLFFHPRLLDLIESILGSEILLYPNYSVRPKLPDFEPARVLWHQDAGYTEQGNNGGEVVKLRMVNVWTPLVPANVRNGCMQFIPKTHKLGIVPHKKKQYYLQIANEYLHPRITDAVDMELNPGDVVIFHNLLFHQGLPNRSDQIRWSLDWRYLDARQPTLRREKGHLARSQLHSHLVVKNNKEWAGLTLS